MTDALIHFLSTVGVKTGLKWVKGQALYSFLLLLSTQTAFYYWPLSAIHTSWFFPFLSNLTQMHKVSVLLSTEQIHTSDTLSVSDISLFFHPFIVF